MKKLIKKALKLILPLVLGGFILYWVYCDFDFVKAAEVLQHGINWWWMAFSLLFGISAQVFRGWHWCQMPEPLGAFPRRSDYVNAIFISYAISLVVLQAGGVSRCGIPAKYDGISFAKSSGTVVTERLVDTLTILLITGVMVLLQMPVFITFLEQTGTKIPSLMYLFTSVWFCIILSCGIGAAVLFYYLIRTLSFFGKVKGVVLNVCEGIMSLRNVKNLPFLLLYSFLIWLSYFLHFYFTFYCFAFTARLGLLAALAMFVGGTFVVIVPIPNGAGPWHFAVITMMMLYRVNAIDAGIFALITHGIQTLLVVLLGIYGLAAISFLRRK